MDGLAGKLRTSRLPAAPPAGASGFVALQMLHSPADMPQPKAEDGGPCHLCTASCCRYFALEIDKPKSKRDYDHIRWYLMHEGVVVWVQDDEWYLEVRTTCRHLQHDNTCGIYETRPQICRDYGLPGGDPCEYFTQDLEYDLFFTNDAELETWLAKKKNRKKA
jgi:Fe-S-cluster containining protein